MAPSAPVSAIEKRAPILLAVGFVSLLGLLYVNRTYRAYRATYMRQAPEVPGCIQASAIDLLTESVVSGTEAHAGPSGETFFLRRNEDAAVGCASLVDLELARRLTGAFAELAPDKRARGFVKIAKAAASGPGGDKWAYATYLLGSSAIKALPKTPEITAAADELELSYACRFDAARPCPTRPKEPITTWVIGVPGGVGVAVPFLLLGFEGVRRLASGRKKKPKKQA